MDDLVSEFVAVTGASVNEARQMLEVMFHCRAYCITEQSGNEGRQNAGDHVDQFLLGGEGWEVEQMQSRTLFTTLVQYAHTFRIILIVAHHSC